MDLLETKEFHISVLGNKTGETFAGKFRTLRRLSHRQELARDRIYRDLLGEQPENASERAKEQAEVLSDIQVCLREVPAWFKEAGMGLDLVDDSILTEVWNQTVKARVEAIQEVQERAKEASDKLKDAVEKGEVAKE